MKRHAMVVVLGAWMLAGVCRPIPSAMAGTMAQRNQEASRLVDEALYYEVSGADAERNALLQSALEQVPQYAPAMWHSGHVQQRNRWLKIEELVRVSADDTRLAAYRRIRPQYPDTVEGQLALAEWCAKRKLAEQQRAHLTKVLQISPDHEPARRLLGYRRVEGAWLTAEEIARADARQRQAAAALQAWRPKLIKIVDDLQSRSQRKREAARQRLLAVTDSAAIAALEAVFSDHREEMALLLIQVLANMPEAEASAALARQAVHSSWEAVREAAAKELAPRDFHSFLPMLLAAMGTPVQSRAHLYAAPDGRLTYRHAFFRNGQEQNQVAVFETEYRPTLLYGENPKEVSQARAALAEARRRDALRKAWTREMTMVQRNAIVRQFNDRIGSVLSKVTGVNLPSTSESWWAWWNDYNEVFIAGTRPIQGAFFRDTVSSEDPYRYLPGSPRRTDDRRRSSGPTGPAVDPTRTSMGSVSGSRLSTASRSAPTMRVECLVAGTLVWTESGPVPVERIQVGDRVLSQNPRTGCLACKPVLKTTIRPRGEILEIETRDEPIRCSGGHPFWVSGEGWVKARELKSGTQMHGVTGTLEVVSVAPAGRQQTHNLIVADFHTYLVGKAKVLSHDNTIRKPTDTLVPGLAIRD